MKKANSTDNGLYVKLSDVADGDSENKPSAEKDSEHVAHDELQRNQFSHTCLKKKKKEHFNGFNSSELPRYHQVGLLSTAVRLSMKSC